MKSGATLALAVTLGAAGVFAYWYLSRNPEAIPAAGAGERAPAADEAERLTPDSEVLAGTNATQAPAAAPASKAPSRPHTPLAQAVSQRSPSARAQALQQIADQAD